MTELRHTTGDSLELENRFASRAAHMKPSEIRSLFAVASRPDIVSLAGGMPNLSALPMDMMAELFAILLPQMALKLCNTVAVKVIHYFANKSVKLWRLKEFALILMM